MHTLTSNSKFSRVKDLFDRNVNVRKRTLCVHLLRRNARIDDKYRSKKKKGLLNFAFFINK